MELPGFIKNNKGFVCIACSQVVPPHASSSRDHCNHCLTGLHVDIHPGDRMNECGGVLRPIGIQPKSGKLKIVYRCEACSEQIFNSIAPDDDMEMLAELASMPW